MTILDDYEEELNRIREELYEESKAYTQQEWIEKINRDACDFLAEHGLTLSRA